MQATMIYHVTEWYDNDCEQFYFDTSKVTPTNAFEVAYAEMLASAAKARKKRVQISSACDARFGEYQNEMPAWTRLLACPPCHVDDDVNILIG